MENGLGTEPFSERPENVFQDPNNKSVCVFYAAGEPHMIPPDKAVVRFRFEKSISAKSFSADSRKFVGRGRP